VPLFNFALRPLADIQPWRSSQGLHLSWFGLSDGWFWLALGGQEILRSDGEPTEGELPFLDHHVAQLWEDLLAILPSVLAPVPDDIAQKMAQPREWNATVERVRALDEEPARLAAALGFFGERQLDNHYVVAAPRVHFWRHGETIHASWSTPPNDVSWTHVEGHAAMPFANFLLELRAFDAAFLTLMKERVAAVVAHRGLPDGEAHVRIDFARLEVEQVERGVWLDAALERAAPPVDWAEVRWMLSRGLAQ